MRACASVREPALHADVADRRIFVLEPLAEDELQELLDRPPAPNPAIAALLTQPSALDGE